jgi:hypothetical protein
MPEVFDTVERFELVASSVSVTVAFGTTAPVASVTVPLMFPVELWPNSEKPQNATANSRKIPLDLSVSNIVVSLPKKL